MIIVPTPGNTRFFTVSTPTASQLHWLEIIPEQQDGSSPQEFLAVHTPDAYLPIIFILSGHLITIIKLPNEGGGAGYI